MRKMWLWLGVWACSADTAPAESVPADPVRVVFLSDTHVIGPQYVCCSESDGVDNASIMRTPERLESTIAKINAIDPPPDHVFVLGDIVHDAHHGTDASWYQDNDNAWSIAADLFAQLDAPVHLVWGNHDYEVKCGAGGDHHPRAFTHGLIQQFFDAPTHEIVRAGGWSFVMLNSQLGPTWDPEDPACNTSLGSFGEEQLAWLDEELSGGQPTVVMTHHHQLTSIATEENAGPYPDLSSVLARHDNVQLHMAGHLHRWYDLEPSGITPVRHLIVGATRYDDDNFWVVEFGEETFEILDFDKSQWFTTCSDSWDYMGPPTPTDAAELGDCSI